MSATDKPTVLPPGKLSPALLSQMLHTMPTRHPRLLLGPSVGEDAAVIDFPHDKLLVVKSDPITFATDAIGYYAVNVCANDLAVTGATPLFFLPTLLLPAHSTTEASLQAIFAQLAEACKALDITVAGGHTEVTPAVNQVVIAGTMLGVVEQDQHITSGGCQPGDALLLIGDVPIEAASIIARERRSELLAQGWKGSALDQAAAYLFTPGISVVNAALTAARTGQITAMHDPTEGGVISGIREIAQAAGLGVTVELDSISIDPLADRLCRAFAMDALGSIASGALLATAHPTHVPNLLRLWSEIGLRGHVIGHISEAADGLVALRGGRTTEFPEFPTDEITKLWR